MDGRILVNQILFNSVKFTYNKVMGPTLHKIRLPWPEGGSTHALGFIPEASVELKSTLALITHGYTSHKGSVLNWAVRLAEEGVSCLLFDLPGHYLGGFCDVHNIDAFKTHAHELFASGHTQLLSLLKDQRPLDDHLYEEAKLVFCGHSLGGLLALKALELDTFKAFSKQAIAVGLGLPPRGQTHLFSSNFYKSTLHIRGQLVSKALDPEVVFPWISSEKEQLVIKGQRIHFITGQDDLVVADDGTERLVDQLIRLGNEVTLERPTKLPHHQPELAAGHVKKFFKKSGLI
jgi:alpha-beta hydrolase superfamily lysophospholipase